LRDTFRNSNKQKTRGDTLRIDLEALERWKERNHEERLKFVKQHAEWLKKTASEEWSEQEARLSR